VVNDMLRLDERQGCPEGILTAQLYDRRSVMLWACGRSQEAVADIQHAIDLFVAEDDLFNAESLNSNLGLVYWSMGELHLAEHYLLRAISYYKHIGAVQFMVPDIGNMGLVELMRGNLARAQEWFEEQISLGRQLEYWSEVYRGVSNLSDVYYYLGDYARVIADHETTQNYYRRRGSREGYGVGKLWVACARHQLGEQEEALDEMRRGLDWCLEYNSQVLELLCRRCLAWFSPPAEREPLLLRSLELARAQKKLFEEAAALLGLAQVAQQEVRRQEYWRAGAAILEQMGAAGWLEGHTPDAPPFLPMFV
jgi:tetratricopeptide (TPR) repeat protein